MGPPLADWADGPVVLEVVFVAGRARGRRVLLHEGDARVVAGHGEGWALWLEDDRLLLSRGDATGVRCDAARWRAGQPCRVRLRWSGTAQGLRFVDGEACGRRLRPGDGRGRRAFAGDAAEAGGQAVVEAESDPLLLADLPVARGIVVGGLRDRAGGHVVMRFGETRGELVLALRVARRCASSPVPAWTADPRAATLAVGPLGWRYRAPRQDGVRWLWDFDDEVVVAPEATRPGALVPAAVDVIGVGRDGSARRLRSPRRRRGVRPVTVFEPGEAGYAAYRIPALVMAGDGDLVALAEARRESLSDAAPTKHLLAKRSADGGATWGDALPVAAGHGDAASCMNPSPIVSGDRLVVVFNVLSGTEWEVARGDARSVLCVVEGADHGRAWGEPRAIGATLRLPAGVEAAWPRPDGWRVQVGTLGHAARLRRGPHAGRLCAVGHATFGEGSVFDSVAFLFWSDDDGVTWTSGPAIVRRDDGTPARGLNESTLAELPDGRLFVTSRHYRDGRPVGRRAACLVAWDEGGEARPGPVRTQRELIDSGAQGSLLAVDDPALPLGRLRFCNPAHPTARVRLTLRESLDGGGTWPHERLLVAGRAGYSDMAELPGGATGVLFEDGGRGRVSFLRVPP